MVLHHLADEIGLAAELGDHGQEILSMVYAHCLDYQSLNHMPQWFERTDLNMILDLEGLTEKQLLGALDSMERLDSEALQQRLFENVCRRYQVKPSAVVYDVTNPYLYGRRCPLGKRGHDKEGVQGHPLVQIGLSVTQEEGFPLFHLAQGKTIKAGLEKYFDHQGRLQPDALVRAEEFDGYSCLFCTRPMPTRQMLSLYFNKDILSRKHFGVSKASFSCARFAIGWPNGFRLMCSSAIWPICCCLCCNIDSARQSSPPNMPWMN